MIKFIRTERYPNPVAVFAGPPVHEYQETGFGPVSTTSYRFRLNEDEMRQRITEDRDADEIRRALAVLEREADFPWEEVIVDDIEQGKES